MCFFCVLKDPDCLVWEFVFKEQKQNHHSSAKQPLEVEEVAKGKRKKGGDKKGKAWWRLGEVKQRQQNG